MSSAVDEFSEFHDPRLVQLYDRLNPPGDDARFYVSLTEELAAARVLDLGCGTGAIATALAERGHDVVAVDPSPEMLAVARARPGGELVHWIEGDAAELEPTMCADFAFMSAHVAQVIHDEAAWRSTLAGLHRALRAGGQLAFESRNPAARAWRDWIPEHSYQHLATDQGSLDVWFETIDVADDLVRYEIHYWFAADGEELISPGTLRFRSLIALTESLTETGFSVSDVFGDWDRAPVVATSPELIIVATRD